MFIGHFAPAILAASHRKSPGLATLFVAGQLADLVYFPLAIMGVEKLRITPGISKMNPMDLYHMPYTHSLLGNALLALVFGLIVAAVSKQRMAGILAGLVVLSHWLCDWLVHVPDMTLLGAPPKLGLGLWNYPWIEIPLELGITFGALAFYAYRTRPVGPKAQINLMVLAVVLLLVQVYNWAAPQPTAYSVVLPLSALFAYGLFTWLAWRVEKTRRFAR